MSLAHARGSDQETTPPYNPLGTDGFEFVEFTADNFDTLGPMFESLGFTAVAKHRTKNVIRYQQGDINFLVNCEPRAQALQFRQEHGRSACAMAFRVDDAQKALRLARERGAEIYKREKVSPLELNIPAIMGIGGSLIFLVDRYGDNTIYDVDFLTVAEPGQNDAGLLKIDHLTHNVYPGHMDRWAEFYEKVFNFREIHYFDIRGQQTGLTSRAMTSPCGLIKIPINESEDEQSQINEYLRDYRGEGIQHIALTTDDIYATIDKLRANGIKFLEVPDAYYDMVDERLPGHNEPIALLKQRKILIDGQYAEGHVSLLLQIFTENMIGPIFFEIIQRKGDEGFGEGNFQALFDAIERDQMKRLVLQHKQ